MEKSIIVCMVHFGEAGKMFHTKAKANVLKDIIDVTSPLVNEVKFNISKNDISTFQAS